MKTEYWPFDLSIDHMIYQCVCGGGLYCQVRSVSEAEPNWSRLQGEWKEIK
jgi:hypothetical protein